MNWKWKETPPKPEDFVEYRTCFACGKGHIQAINRWPDESRINPLIGEKEVCKRCGEVSLPAVARVTWGSHLFKGYLTQEWIPGSGVDMTQEFIRYLKEVTP